MEQIKFFREEYFSLEMHKVLRFFMGRLSPVSDWQEKLVYKFKADFGENL